MFSVDQIDTRTGTASTYEFSHGNTLPLTGVPFGMNYLSVQTTQADTPWWFDPHQTAFAGLRITHQPSPWIGDYQHVLFTPLSGDGFAETPLLTYDPKAATFAPHLLHLTEQGQQIAMTATAGLTGGAIRLHSLTGTTLRLRITSPKSAYVNTENNVITLTTSNFSGSEDPDFTMWLTLTVPEGQPLPTVEAAGTDATDLVFTTATAEVRFATSFLSAQQGKLNLSRLAQFSFDDLVAVHREAWQTHFDQIEVSDHHADRENLFYANFYRALLFPMRFYEEDAKGAPQHYDTTSKTVRPGKLFTNIGFWDTYKSSFPLYTLLMPAQYHDFLEGCLNSFKETGFLPRWLSPDERGMMPGTMVDAVIADAAVKGQAQDLMPQFLEAMIHGAETISHDPKYGREGLAEYLELGYVPAEIHESVNKTLDYAYSDWLISVVATSLGKTEIAAKYAKRSENWRNVFDPSVKLMHSKDKAGHFTPGFDDLAWGNGFTEGGAWQSSFAVYEDLPGLIEATGGKDAFVENLHKMVNQPAVYHVGSYGGTIHEMRELAAQPFGQLAISNQPSFHLPYLFAIASDSHSTELVVKQLLLHAFSTAPEGYPGDEDNGSMASWVLWSGLGFYPVTPGSGKYVLGVPFFDHVAIHLPNGNTLTLTTPNNHDALNFVGERTLNGKPLNGPFISHAALEAGGEMRTTLQLLG
ncbi:GH92 family glycosyl hydrolase [Lacticaseibacillus mingshuiensis]|uniref:GH92 family glycosyl hydrolase n=1 Tax=Lacticaseibacillus mingshuiensis TaxID=2799574 RepID=A0ABW4CF17_9LACO|nr:GH92 family glycosyl hydrolase [Lacticaseibacillus mingshuiensis]